jgi:MYXO-CTERM domain-containing protein
MQRLCVVTAAALTLLAARPAHAYCLSGNMGGTKCAAFPKTTITYRVSSNLSDAAILGAIDKAFATWQGVTCTGLNFTKGAAFAINTPFDQASDAISIYWVTQNSELPTGMDPKYYAYSFHGFTASGDLSGSSVAFNAFGYKWNATGGAADTFDVQNVLTQYVGLMIGLDYSQQAGAVMYKDLGYALTPDKRTLKQDDINAVSALYPGTCAASPAADSSCASKCTVGPPGPTPDAGLKKDTQAPPTGDGKTTTGDGKTTTGDGKTTIYDGSVIKYDGSTTTGCTSSSQCASGQICSVDHVCVNTTSGGGKSCGCLVAGRPDRAPPALAFLALAGVGLFLLRRRRSR